MSAESDWSLNSFKSGFLPIFEHNSDTEPIGVLTFTPSGKPYFCVRVPGHKRKLYKLVVEWAQSLGFAVEEKT